MHRLLFLILHHVTVGSLGRHLLRLVIAIVVTKKSVLLRPDVVVCRPLLILAVDPILLAASTVGGGV